MNGLSRAVLDLTGFLESNRIPYMVIGGFANLIWGNPRLTQDVDVTVSVAEAAWPHFVSEVTARYRPTVVEPLEFVRRTRVLPIVCEEDVNADLIFAALPFEDQAIARAVAIPLEGGSVRICTAEDLILHKVISDRPRDQEDVEGVLIRQRGKLDLDYLRPRVVELAKGLDRPEIAEKFAETMKRTGEQNP